MQNPTSSPWPWRRGFLTRLDSFDTNHRCVSGLGRWSCGVAVSRGEFWQTTDGGFYTTRRLARITSERPSSDSNSSRSRRGSQSCALLPAPEEAHGTPHQGRRQGQVPYFFLPLTPSEFGQIHHSGSIFFSFLSSEPECTLFHEKRILFQKTAKILAEICI